MRQNQLIMDKKVISYRPEIDGLRAIAVIAVILFHSDISYVSGGYVGVDIFFVISGYLIISIIYKQKIQNNFNYKDFIIRRIRRIIPASYFMMLGTLLLFFPVFTADLYNDLSRSLLSQIVFSSNFYFWQVSGYFTESAELKPLLHTWSLSVEEQFYFLFPVLLIISFKYFKNYIFQVVLLLSLISLCLSVYFGNNYPDAGFYLLLTRAWELAFGGLLAIRLIESKNKIKNKCNAEIMSVIGLCLILYSIIYFDNTISFPSFYALIPVLGTVLVIYSCDSHITLIRTLLSRKYVVFIGLLSYSLYLWHWPILTYMKYISFDSLGSTKLLESYLVIFIVSLFSYYCIEKPVRYNKNVFNIKRLVTLTAISSTILLSSAVYIINADGMANRTPEIANFSERKDFLIPEIEKDCQDKFNDSKIDFVCESDNFDNLSSSPFLVWGDSHATFMVPAIKNASKELNARFLYTSYSGCPPLLGVIYKHEPETYKCNEFNEQVVNYVLNNDIKLVFLVFRHNLYIHSYDQIDEKLRTPIQLEVENIPNKEIHSSIEAFKIGFKRLSDKLHDRNVNVVVIRQVPNLNIDPKKTLYRSLVLKKESSELPKRKRTEIEERSRIALNIFEMNNVEVFDLTEKFCDELSCFAFKNGKSLYRDPSHIGFYGTIHIRDSIKTMLQKYTI